MRALLLVGSDCIVPGIGTSMIRLASRLEETGVVAIASPGFIESCRPRIDEAIERCLARGASELVIQPYTIIMTKVMQREMRSIRKQLRRQRPDLAVLEARPFAEHPALGQIVFQRANEADYAVAHGITPMPITLAHANHVNRPVAAALHLPPNDSEAWRPMYQLRPSGLLLVAEGPERSAWGWPLKSMLEWLRFSQRYQDVRLSLFDEGHAAFEGVVEQFLRQGIHDIAVVPYMLQMNGDVVATLIEYTQNLSKLFPQLNLVLASHLGYDQRLAVVLQQRLEEAVGEHRKLAPSAPIVFQPGR